MSEPIEESYFKWLYSKVASVDHPTPSLTYWNLFHMLHSIEFVYTVPGDDNRAEDGRMLRTEFLHEAFMHTPEEPWLHLECSMLEMFIAFSRHCAFQTDMRINEWFWIFMTNLGLETLNDVDPDFGQDVFDTMERVNLRTYDRSGARGGIFPLRNPPHDQRKVEIWYQFCEYLIDQENI